MLGPCMPLPPHRDPTIPASPFGRQDLADAAKDLGWDWRNSIRIYDESILDTINQARTSNTWSQVVFVASKKRDGSYRYHDVPPTAAMLDLYEYNHAMAYHDVRFGGYRLNTALVRKFARTLEYGGRYYRADYQTMKREERPHITIDGNETCELDFSALHPTLLYLELGMSVPDDPYACTVNRDDYKLALNIALNAKDKTQACTSVARTIAVQRINAQRAAQGLDKLTQKQQWDTIPTDDDERRAGICIEALDNDPLRSRYYMGDGARLQKVDSDIAGAVMFGAVKNDIPTLCMHDSFIVKQDHAAAIRERMILAFQRITKTNHTPKIKQKER